ncbi:MAG TPA: hypothetical protein PKG50_06615 [Candidatus Bipolaricaulis anaerobius]|nr:hypothetical protein [Candidatus Bipolaricaulis sp.]MDD2912574.1 hypothetical protein [Candidatus Bipolaricaulis anaerobius]HNR25074.1 hypothetical protein [Candidatus Bipolaricaulis anaerobius]HNS24428.1 hypothetical protein [Candidatus Bipolaricaulis anaerobius]HOD73065.1 hypothetical protein [Candidatus Bipolaricaulis anaerobius]
MRRFMVRAHDGEIEAEARRLLTALDVDDVEVIRDETVAEAWLDDLEARRTIYGLAEIREYLERLIKG